MMFSDPGWLAGGLAACLCLLWMWRRYDARQHAALARFISPHLRTELTQSVSIGRRRWQRGLKLGAVALLFVALAGPLLGYTWEEISRRGNEIVFALDTSRSMSTPDMKPDRLTRAKLAIDDFTDGLDGDAVGLVAFAGDAFLVCPITLDYGAFHESLSAVDINTIPRGGTNMSSAIREAQAALRRRPGSDKILILVTDGEDLEGGALIAAKAAAREDGLKIYTIGVGTAQGDLIPLSTNRIDGFVKDDSGSFVKSRLDETVLKAIAAATGGLYAPLGTEGQGLETIYKAGLSPLLKHNLASRRQKVYIQRYQWPLAASLGLLLASLPIGSRRRSGERGRSRVPASRIASGMAVISTVLLLLLPLGPTGRARASASSAQAAYTRGDFVKAAEEYAAAAKHDPNKPSLAFNAGTAAYRAGQYPQATEAFQESIKRAPAGSPQRLADQEDAYYNLGNTLYRTGQKTAQNAPDQTRQNWTQAVKAYDTALQLRPDDADSKFNRDFVKRKIEELKKQQQNKPQDRPQNHNQTQNQPQSQQQKQGSPQQPPGSPPPARPPPPSTGQPKPAESGADQADTQRFPGQMTREEARELLDSQKGDERHALGLPAARREADSPPDKPIKDW